MKIDVDLPFTWCPKCHYMEIREIKFNTDNRGFVCLRSCENEDICRNLYLEMKDDGWSKTV